jgi:hypothetical protein
MFEYSPVGSLPHLSIDAVAPLDIAVAARRSRVCDRTRTAAMYGLPLQVAEPRVLEVRSPEDCDARLFRASQIARVTPDGRPRTTPDGPFDLIVLHRTLDRLFGAQDREHARRGSLAVLEWAAALLSPAGALVGSVSNRYAGWHPAYWGRSTAHGQAWFGAQRCAQLLAAASLKRAEIFGLHPTADAPLAILSLESQHYRHHALRELRRHAVALGRLGYALRAAWHATGLGRQLHRDLMFWAFRT